jgi:hypothetical protein
MPACRFPPPWSIEKLEACFRRDRYNLPRGNRGMAHMNKTIRTPIAM